MCVCVFCVCPSLLYCDTHLVERPLRSLQSWRESACAPSIARRRRTACLQFLFLSLAPSLSSLSPSLFRSLLCPTSLSLYPLPPPCSLLIWFFSSPRSFRFRNLLNARGDFFLVVERQFVSPRCSSSPPICRTTRPHVAGPMCTAPRGGRGPPWSNPPRPLGNGGGWVGGYRCHVSPLSWQHAIDSQLCDFGPLHCTSVIVALFLIPV